MGGLAGAFTLSGFGCFRRRIKVRVQRGRTLSLHLLEPGSDLTETGDKNRRRSRKFIHVNLTFFTNSERENAQKYRLLKFRFSLVCVCNRMEQVQVFIFTHSVVCLECVCVLAERSFNVFMRTDSESAGPD